MTVLEWLERYGRACEKASAMAGTPQQGQAEQERDSLLTEISDAIDGLKDCKSARVLYLRFIRRMEWTEICEATGLSRSTVYRHYYRGMKQIDTE